MSAATTTAPSTAEIDAAITAVGASGPQDMGKVMALLKGYRWPGNVRELKNIMERLSIMVAGDVIEPQHLPSPIHTTSAVRNDEFEKLLAIENIRDARSEFERHYINRKLEEFGQNISRTADKIGLERSHLHRKLKQFNEGTSDAVVTPLSGTALAGTPSQSDEG